jgi:hypothetical protein
MKGFWIPERDAAEKVGVDRKVFKAARDAVCERGVDFDLPHGAIEYSTEGLRKVFAHLQLSWAMFEYGKKLLTASVKDERHETTYDMRITRKYRNRRILGAPDPICEGRVARVRAHNGRPWNKDMTGKTLTCRHVEEDLFETVSLA